MGKAAISTEPCVVVRPEAWGSAMDVAMAPPIPGHELDRNFPTVAEARAYAASIAAMHDRVIVDQTAGEQARGGDQ